MNKNSQKQTLRELEATVKEMKELHAKRKQLMQKLSESENSSDNSQKK